MRSWLSARGIVRLHVVTMSGVGRLSFNRGVNDFFGEKSWLMWMMIV